MIDLSPNAVTLHDTDDDALALRTEGLEYRQIAEAQGVAPSTAHRRVMRALRRQRVRQAELREDVRDIDLLKLARLEQAFWPAAMAGDLKAAQFIYRVINGRRL